MQGAQGEIGPQGAQGISGIAGKDGDLGERGPQGERGEQGPAGKLPMVKAYVHDAVHYAGDVVSHVGSTWQAQRDTGKTPPHPDWICLAAAAHAFCIRGTYKEEETYGAFDIVMKESSSFIAIKDAPGSCPGPGWQLLAASGRRGVAGERGAPGERGPKGEPGAKGEAPPRLTGWTIDSKHYRAVPVLSDGKEGPPLELTDLFEQFHVETK
jgi:hypothetical protein